MLRGVRSPAVCLLVALGLLLGCSAKPPPVRVPPRIDLTQWGRIGVVGFSGASPELASLATREFVAMLQSAQPGVPILELGAAPRVLAEVGRAELDFEAGRAIGERFRVDAVFTGTLEVGEPKPSVRVGRSLSSLHARADVSGELAAKLLETGAGATVWSRSSTATAGVARVGVREGALPSFGATDPAQLHGDLVRRLVSELGPDFHSRWQRP